jgi:hypothetical protein
MGKRGEWNPKPRKIKYYWEYEDLKPGDLHESPMCDKGEPLKPTKKRSKRSTSDTSNERPYD